VSTVTLTPEEFTLVDYDAARVRALVDEAIATVGLPDVSVSVVVDEVLPSPLAVSAVAVADGAVELWFAGGCFEDPQRQGKLQEELTRTELATAMVRAQDRLGGGFADAPADGELSDRQRAIWDVSAEGRVAALGLPVREPRRRYTFRLYGGFNDVADAEYDRLRSGAPLTWAELEAVDARLDAADTRVRPKKRVVRKDALRAPAPS
jgi:hypothetical protein